MKTKEVLLEYFTVQEANVFVFYRIPKELFTNPKYKHMSAEAKILYGLLLDRNSLSLKNGWVDERGCIYIYFSREEAMEMLGIANPKATNLFRELREVNLIEEVRQGLGKANIIFVKKFVQQHETIATPQNQGNLDSGIKKNLTQESRKSEVKNQENLEEIILNYNNTYMNNNQSVSPVNQEIQNENLIDRQTDMLPDERELRELERMLKNGQTALFHSQLFIESVIKKLYTNGQMPYILKMGLTHTDIKDRLRLLTHKHIDWALAKMSNVKTNKELYFAKCLLTAIVEVDVDDFIAMSDLEDDESIEPEKKSSSMENIPKRDNFEQREYTDEELESFYANLAEEPTIPEEHRGHADTIVEETVLEPEWTDDRGQEPGACVPLSSEECSPSSDARDAEKNAGDNMSRLEMAAVSIRENMSALLAEARKPAEAPANTPQPHIVTSGGIAGFSEAAPSMPPPVLEQASGGLLDTQEQAELSCAPDDCGSLAGFLLPQAREEADTMLEQEEEPGTQKSVLGDGECQEPPYMGSLEQVIAKYEHTIGPATPEIAEAMSDWLTRGCDPSLLSRYIDEAHSCNIPTWAYINAVIKENVGKNIWTLEQYDALKQEQQSVAWQRGALYRCRLPVADVPEKMVATKANQAEVEKEFWRQYNQYCVQPESH